jgi:outer membrane protein assembly factor BamB
MPRLLWLVCFALVAQVLSQTKIPWVAFNGGGSRSGINNKETAISQTTVKNLVQKWSVTLSDACDSSPIFLPDVKTVNGTVDLVFYTSRGGSNLYAQNAATGAIVWQHTENVGSGVVMASPALDPNLNYIYAYRNDGKIHKYDVTNGQEASGLGFPATITIIYSVEKGSSSINIFGGYLYQTISGYIGDAGHYVGHVVAIKLSDGSVTVFNTLCSDKRMLLGTNSSASNYCGDVESGVWARAGAVQDPDDGSLYIVSGNGLFNADQTNGRDYGDSVIRLAAGLPASNVLLDSYTPTNASKLQQEDLDLGSAGFCILPVQSKSKTPYMGLQAGKDQTLRLLNRRDFSGKGHPGVIAGELQIYPLNQGGNVYSQPLAWIDPANNQTWIFVGNDYGFSAYTLNTDANGVSTIKQEYLFKNVTGSSPFMANNVLFLQGSTHIYAMVPQTGALLWNTTANGLHWQSPLVVNGMLFWTDSNRGSHAFGLP